MKNPTDEQLQEQIAKVRGWRECRISGGSVLWGYNPDNFWVEVPNWPTDRNASYELPVKNKDEYQRFLSAIETWYELRSAYDESLAWLLYKGYRWDDCDSCEGEPHGVSEDCTDCNGAGGEWEQV